MGEERKHIMNNNIMFENSKINTNTNTNTNMNMNMNTNTNSNNDNSFFEKVFYDFLVNKGIKKDMLRTNEIMEIENELTTEISDYLKEIN